MLIHVQRHASIGKQIVLLDGINVGPLKWCVCGCGLNRYVHEDMDSISKCKGSFNRVRTYLKST